MNLDRPVEHGMVQSVDPEGKDFESFYRSNYAAISRFVLRRVPLSVHDDVVSNTFTVAWKKFESASTPSLAWLYKIATYEVAHERRRISRSSNLVDFRAVERDGSITLETYFDVSSGLAQLSDRDAEAIRLVHWDGLSRGEAAEVVGCSTKAFNVRYHRAMKRFTSTLHRIQNQEPTTAVLPKETD